MTAYVFTASQKANIRRYAGYPNPLAVEADQVIWHTQAYLDLEFKLVAQNPEVGAMVVTKLAEIADLEAALLASADNLDTDQLAVIKSNPRELAQRNALYTMWRMQLVEMMGVAPGPYLSSRKGFAS